MPRANWTTSITKAAKLARRRPLTRLAVSRPAVPGTVVPVGTLMTLPLLLLVVPVPDGRRAGQPGSRASRRAASARGRMLRPGAPVPVTCDDHHWCADDEGQRGAQQVMRDEPVSASWSIVPNEDGTYYPLPATRGRPRRPRPPERPHGADR